MVLATITPSSGTRPANGRGGGTRRRRGRTEILSRARVPAERATGPLRGRQVLGELPTLSDAALVRRTARGRARAGPLVRRLLAATPPRQPPPIDEGDPRTDTRAAAAHVIGVLWASARDGASVRELRQAFGLTRERFEAAYDYLLAHPLLGLALVRDRDELRLARASGVAASIERHRGQPRPVALTKAALEVLAIIAYRQPITLAGIEHIRGTTSDSALATLLQRGLVAPNDHRLFSTTPAFLAYLGLRDLADLPPPADPDVQEHTPGLTLQVGDGL